MVKHYAVTAAVAGCPAVSEDSMPSKRTVPEQEVSELSDEMGRLLALKDGVIAKLTEQRNRARRQRIQADAEIASLTRDRTEAFAEVDKLRRQLGMSSAEIAALTERRDRWKADCEDITTCLNNERQKFMGYLKVVEAARDVHEWLKRNNMAHSAHGRYLADTLAALDAEAAALPETP